MRPAFKYKVLVEHRHVGTGCAKCRVLGKEVSVTTREDVDLGVVQAREVAKAMEATISCTEKSTRCRAAMLRKLTVENHTSSLRCCGVVSWERYTLEEDPFKLIWHDDVGSTLNVATFVLIVVAAVNDADAVKTPTESALKKRSDSRA